MILGKIGIRGKLNLLLLLPLVAVLLVALPFLLGQVSAARSALSIGSSSSPNATLRSTVRHG